MYFAEYDGAVGHGESLEEALTSLEDANGSAPIQEISFYEGSLIQVELVVKQTPQKIKTNK